MALVTGTLLSLAWLGDSRALLCRGSSSGSAVALTEDHRPQDEPFQSDTSSISLGF